jgi:hypothetical protein
LALSCFDHSDFRIKARCGKQTIDKTGRAEFVGHSGIFGAKDAKYSISGICLSVRDNAEAALPLYSYLPDAVLTSQHTGLKRHSSGPGTYDIFPAHGPKL